MTFGINNEMRIKQLITEDKTSFVSYMIKKIETYDFSTLDNITAFEFPKRSHTEKYFTRSGTYLGGYDAKGSDILFTPFGVNSKVFSIVVYKNEKKIKRLTMNSKKVAKHHPSIINIEEDQTLSSANWYIPKDGNMVILHIICFSCLSKIVTMVT